MFVLKLLKEQIASFCLQSDAVTKTVKKRATTLSAAATFPDDSRFCLNWSCLIMVNLLMLQKLHILSKLEQWLTAALFPVSMTTLSQARRGLLNRDGRFLLFNSLSVQLYHLPISPLFSVLFSSLPASSYKPPSHHWTVVWEMCWSFAGVNDITPSSTRGLIHTFHAICIRMGNLSNYIWSIDVRCINKINSQQAPNTGRFPVWRLCTPLADKCLHQNSHVGNCNNDLVSVMGALPQSSAVCLC